MSTDRRRIPFNRPTLVGGELDNIRRTIEVMHTAAGGEFTAACCSRLEAIHPGARVMLTTSCTDALEMAGLLLDLVDEDEVIVPSFSFVSTANAFALRGSRIVFADVREDTLNLDEQALEARISQRTKAIVLVHYAGVGCEMDRILEIARHHGIQIIEDNAHGLFGHYRGRRLGTFGSLASLSFHETKNLTCGEGGALVINDPRYWQRAEILRDKGTDRQRLFRGEVDKYTWVDLGSSFAISEILAAFLHAQLEASDRITAQRRQLWERYDGHFRGRLEACDVRLPVVPEHCEQSYHMYYLILPGLERRQALAQHLAQRGIASVFHYIPLHLSQMGRAFGGRPGDCPVSERVSDGLLRLPFHHQLSAEDQDYVADEVKRFFGLAS